MKNTVPSLNAKALRYADRKIGCCGKLLHLPFGKDIGNIILGKNFITQNRIVLCNYLSLCFFMSREISFSLFIGEKAVFLLKKRFSL